MTNLNESQVRTITEVMFLPDRILPAHVTIVLGQTLWHRPLEKTVELHSKGLSGKIIFTGGLNPQLHAPESLLMRDAWLQMGHPLSDVLVDPLSTNTLENMANSKAIMEEVGLFEDITIINLISISYHMRRAVETFKQIFEGRSVQLGVVNYPSKHCDPSRWFRDPKGRSLVLGETLKIKRYLPDSKLSATLPDFGEQ